MKKKPSNESDLIGFMIKVQEQLAVLDRKLDTFMTKSLTELASAMPATKPPAPVASNNQPVIRQVNQNPGRPLYRVICADCRKECEIPFKPSGDRPVYCKECFAKRKSNRLPNVIAQAKPQFIPTTSQQVTTPQPVEPQKVIKTKKKSHALKKAPAAKKKVGKKKGR